MTAVVHSRLGELEETIERGLATFVEVGAALAEIRDNDLYKEHYTRFEDYCQERWGWNADYGRKLIASATVRCALKDDYNCSVLPANEGQARPLTKIKEPEQQAQAWTRAQEIAAHDNRKVIAADVEEAVAEVIGGPVEPPEDETPKVHTRDPRIKMLKGAARFIRGARQTSTTTIESKLKVIEGNLRHLIKTIEDGIYAEETA